MAEKQTSNCILFGVSRTHDLHTFLRVVFVVEVDESGAVGQYEYTLVMQ